jgi:hypothetical protein
MLRANTIGLSLLVLSLPLGGRLGAIASTQSSPKTKEGVQSELREKCSQGKGGACLLLALTLDGDHSSDSGELHRRACLAGEDAACPGMRVEHFQRLNARLRELFEEECHHESVYFCHWLGNWEKAKGRFSKAAEAYENSCRSGDTEGCVRAKEMWVAAAKGPLQKNPPPGYRRLWLWVIAVTLGVTLSWEVRRP